MITLRRGTDRRHVQLGDHHVWLTFHPQEPPISPAIDLRALTSLDEIQLAPDVAPVPHPTEGAEVITYVYKGALAQEDSAVSPGVLYAGEFQRMVRGRGDHPKETNASRTVRARMYRITMQQADLGPEVALEQQRFARAQRHNMLCVVASPDGRTGSLRIVHDALIYSSVLDPGRHLFHELGPGRNAWLHIIHGEATLQDIMLNSGDGVGVTLEPSVSLTAQEHTELLLIDIGPPPGPVGIGPCPR